MNLRRYTSSIRILPRGPFDAPGSAGLLVRAVVAAACPAAGREATVSVHGGPSRVLHIEPVDQICTDGDQHQEGGCRECRWSEILWWVVADADPLSGNTSSGS